MLRRSAVGVLLGARSRGQAAVPGNSGSLDAYLRLIQRRGRAGRGFQSPPDRSRTFDSSGAKIAGTAGFDAEAVRSRGPNRKRQAEASGTVPLPGVGCASAGRSFDCVHPVLADPLSAATALAYSCNCFVAHVAERFQPGELAREFERVGLSSATALFGGAGEEAAGRIHPALNPDAQRIQALGEDSVEVTVAGLALAYRLLALNIDKPYMRAIKEGLEGAVEFGTAQNAAEYRAFRVVAGKTGSALTTSGRAGGVVLAGLYSQLRAAGCARGNVAGTIGRIWMQLPLCATDLRSLRRQVRL